MKDGKRHGIGDAYHQNGELLYRGEWKNDKIYIPPFREQKKVKFAVGSGGQGSISVYEDTKTEGCCCEKMQKTARWTETIFKFRIFELFGYLSEIFCLSFWII